MKTIGNEATRNPLNIFGDVQNAIGGIFKTNSYPALAKQAENAEQLAAKLDAAPTGTSVQATPYDVKGHDYVDAAPSPRP